MYKSIKFLTLSASVCAAILCAPMHSAQAENFTPDQKKEIEELFKKLISENPELILDSVSRHREEQEQRTMQSAQKNLKEYQAYFAQDDLPIAGNPDGDVTVVEFFDYNCGYCKKAFQDLQKLIKEDSNVRVVFQEMPILSPSSAKMATISLAALKQGKYFEAHTALMAYRGAQSDEAFYKLAESLDLDMERLKADVQSDDIKSALNKTKTVAQALGIRGTPGFVVGNKIYPGYIPLSSLRTAIRDARAEAAEAKIKAAE